MSIQPIFEKIKYNGKKTEKYQQIKVECKTDISSDTVYKVLGVYSRADIIRKEVQENKLVFGGKASFYVCYENSEGQLAKFECGSEFVGEILHQDKINYNFWARATCLKTETDTTGIKLVISCYVDVAVDFCPLLEVKALSGGENLIVDKCEVPITCSLSKCEGTYPIEQEFELNYRVEDVLNHRANAVVTAVQCGVGCIIIDGEVNLSAILLQSEQKRDIIRENKTLPFRAEIECQDAMPTLKAVASVKIKSFKTDIAVDQDKELSVVTAKVLLSFEGEVFTESTLSICKDAYSLSEEVGINYQSVEAFTPLEMRSIVKNVTGRASVDQLEDGVFLVALFNECAEIAHCKECEEGCEIVGTLTVNALFSNQEGKVFAKKLEAPFEGKIDCGVCFNKEILVTAEKCTAKIISLNQIEIESELIFTVYPRHKDEISYISEISFLGEKAENQNAISVYIALAGEQLWQLSKRLNVSPEVLMQTNKNLQFPLSKDERIIIYRQK